MLIGGWDRISLWICPQLNKKNRDFAKYLQSHKRQNINFISQGKHGDYSSSKPRTEYKQFRQSNLMMGMDQKYQTTSYVSLDRNNRENEIKSIDYVNEIIKNDNEITNLLSYENMKESMFAYK